MLAKAFSRGIGTTRRVLAVNIALITGTFVWYFYAFDYLRGLAELNDLTIWGPTFLSIAAAAVLSTFFMERFRRRIFFLRTWMLAGVFLSFVPAIAGTATEFGITIASVLLGAYFGFGMPICMGYFAASVETEKRGRSGGVVVLFMGLGLVLFNSLGIEDAVLTSIVLAALRLATLAALVFLKPAERHSMPENKVSYRFVVSYKPFILYIVPWIMFCLVNDLTSVVKENVYNENAYDVGIMVNLLAGVFAVVGGFFADSTGRKRLAVAGFASLGIAYAFLGFSSPQYQLFAWNVYNVVDGIAWGAFYPIFLTTLWGDLAQHRNAEKFYALGSLPYLFSNFARVPLGTLVAGAISVPYMVFSFASLFMFFAVVPLVFAPETLPEKIIKQRELEIYVERAQEVAQKYY